MEVMTIMAIAKKILRDVEPTLFNWSHEAKFLGSLIFRGEYQELWVTPTGTILRQLSAEESDYGSMPKEMRGHKGLAGTAYAFGWILALRASWGESPSGWSALYNARPTLY
jgi:hypothetical protein